MKDGLLYSQVLALGELMVNALPCGVMVPGPIPQGNICFILPETY
jgi:hypothetical protein